MTSRRKFIRTLGMGAAALALPLPHRLLASGLMEKKGVRKITILHTNDVHSHIDPFPENDPKYPGMGGAARRAALIKQIRAEEQHVVLLDAGDIFQGTPYFNFFGGELEFKLMTEMGYDAATLGNHDFDAGISGLVKQLPHAGFPLVNANYDFSRTELQGRIKPYTLIERGDIRVGVFGVGIELQGLVDKKLYGETVYTDPIQTAQETANLLRNEKRCDLVICLSHLGYEYGNEKVSDRVLATSTFNIDLIIGGHTHTFLNEPVKMMNREQKPVLINQVGWAGVNLGRIDFDFSSGSADFKAHSGVYEISKKTIGI